MPHLAPNNNGNFPFLVCSLFIMNTLDRNSSTQLTLESLIKCQQKLSAHVHFYICIVNVCWDYAVVVAPY